MGWSFAEAASLFASAQVDDLSDKSGLNCDTLSCTPCLPEGCRFRTRNLHRTRRDARFVQFKNFQELCSACRRASIKGRKFALASRLRQADLLSHSDAVSTL